jgi:hypothetical protein
MLKTLSQRLQYSTSAIALSTASGMRMDMRQCQAIIIQAALTLGLARIERGNIVLIQ